jgi:hypothetical protein
MDIYWSCTSKPAIRLARAFRNPYLTPFAGDKILWDEAFNEERLELFMKADAVVVSSTWGGDKRKERLQQIKGDIPYTEFTPKTRYLDQSAIADDFNTQVVSMARAYCKKLFVIESATISRGFSNFVKKHSTKTHFRLMQDHWTYGQGRIADPIKGQEKGIEIYRHIGFLDHKWKMRENGDIFVLGGLEWDPTSTMSVEDFYWKSVEQIRQKTNRKIVLKAHPASTLNLIPIRENFDNIEIMSPKITLQHVYNRMYAAVIDNSTSCFELLEAGIPVFCSKDSFV